MLSFKIYLLWSLPGNGKSKNAIISCQSLAGFFLEGKGSGILIINEIYIGNLEKDECPVKEEPIHFNINLFYTITPIITTKN